MTNKERVLLKITEEDKPSALFLALRTSRHSPVGAKDLRRHWQW